MKRSTVLITGASGNLGSAVMTSLYEKGYRLCATFNAQPLAPEVAALAEDIHQLDLADAVKVQHHVDDLIERYPDLNAAVLLVGGFVMGGLQETDEEVIDQQIQLNFKTAYHVVRSLFPHFERMNGGQFILIGARPALEPQFGKNSIAYTLSKTLVVQLSGLINALGRGKHIHSTVVVPSTIDTAANRASMPKADPATWVKAADLAETIAFILSEPGSNLRDSVLKVYHDV